MVRFSKLKPSLAKIISPRFVPPRDLADAIDSWPSWKALLGKQKGLLLLLIGLKYPCCRKFFVLAYQKHHNVSVPEKRVFLALVDTARQFYRESAYAMLREDIDYIKGPSKIHGFCVYLRKLHVTRPGTVGVRLGAGTQRFVIKGYSLQAKKKSTVS